LLLIAFKRFVIQRRSQQPANFNDLHREREGFPMSQEDKSSTHIKKPELKIRGARAWVGRGAALVPLIAGGKRPAQKGWINAPITTRAEVDNLFAEQPKANIGIITGAVSGLIAVDLDGPEGEASLKALEAAHGPLPMTTTVRTPRGRHLYFRYSGLRIPNSAGKLGPGLDVRGDGGFVVGVGSAHPSGAIYRYADRLTPKRVGIANIPGWLLEKIAAPARETSVVDPPTIAPEILERAQRYAEAIKRAECERLVKAPAGHRNDTLNRCAFVLGQFLPHGLLDEGEVMQQLAQIAEQIGLGPAESGSTIQSGLAAGQRCPRDLIHLGAAEAAAPVDGRQPEQATDDITRELAAFGHTDADNAHRLARRAANQLLFAPGLGFLVWDEGHWGPDTAFQRYVLAEDTARRIAAEAEYLPAIMQDSRIAFGRRSLNKLELERMLELAKPLIAVDVAQLDACPFLLNVQNGTIDLRTGDLQDHDPRDLITKIAPVAFDPAAKCPRWKGFLKEVCGRDLELIRYLRHAIGYTLTADKGNKIFFWLKAPAGPARACSLTPSARCWASLDKTHHSPPSW
jgi:putative DNA primase/helicase